VSGISVNEIGVGAWRGYRSEGLLLSRIVTDTSGVRRLDSIACLWLSENACYLENIGLLPERKNAVQGNMTSRVMIVWRVGILITGFG